MFLCVFSDGSLKSLPTISLLVCTRDVSISCLSGLVVKLYMQHSLRGAICCFTYTGIYYYNCLAFCLLLDYVWFYTILLFDLEVISLFYEVMFFKFCLVWGLQMSSLDLTLFVCFYNMLKSEFGWLSLLIIKLC